MNIAEIIVLSAAGGFLLMLFSAIGICWVKRRKDDIPADPQDQMFLAHKLWCDALDEAALSGDVKEYDRIKAIGWRKFSGELV